MTQGLPAAATWSPRRQVVLAGAVLLVVVVVLAVFAGLSAFSGYEFRYFSKEPAESLSGEAYVGWLAHLTVLTWAGAAATSLFAGFLLRVGGSAASATFLLALGSFTALLVLDDFFLLHESVYPRLGVPEEGVYITYGVLVLVLARRFTARLRGHAVLLAVVAPLFWGTSVGFDFVQETWGVSLHLLEDGAKTVGVAMWSVFLVDAAAHEVLFAMGGRGAAADDLRAEA